MIYSCENISEFTTLVLSDELNLPPYFNKIVNACMRRDATISFEILGTRSINFVVKTKHLVRGYWVSHTMTCYSIYVDAAYVQITMNPEWSSWQPRLVADRTLKWMGGELQNLILYSHIHETKEIEEMLDEYFAALEKCHEKIVVY